MRNNTTGNLENHSIGIFESYGENLLNAPEMANFRLSKLYDQAAPALSGILNVLTQNRNTDYSDLKPEVAEQRKSEKLHEARKHLLDILKTEIEETANNVINVENRILNETITKPTDNDTVNLQHDMKLQEIRNHISNLSIERRNYELQKAVNNGNKDILEAVATAPIAIVDPEVLLEHRKDYAFKHNPELLTTYNNSKQLRSICRMKAGNVNATAVSMLQSEDVIDPITAREHFNAFPPRNEHEAQCAKRKIHQEMSEELSKQQLTTLDKREV